MFRLLLIILAVLPLGHSISALDQLAPTVAILRFGPSASNAITEGAILDVLESYGYITADEHRQLEERQNLNGEKISIFWGDAGYDLPTVNLMVEAALDRDLDVLIALNTPVAQIAVAATLEMEDPPALLFTAVNTPYAAGIAEASCIKPGHVTGSETLTEYEYVLSMLRLQDPGLSRIGLLYATSLTSGNDALERISALTEEMGIEVHSVGVTGLADLRTASEALADHEVDALVLASDYIVSAGLPIVVAIANEYGIPVFHPSMGAIEFGATIGAGFASYYRRGDNLGVLLTSSLAGELDIATTAINIDRGNQLGVNLDAAELQAIEISDELLRQADAVMSGGRITRASVLVLQRIARRGVILPLEERIEDDREFLESLRCTAEMIGAQQEALDAAGE